MAINPEDLNLDDGPVLFEEGRHTVGVRLLNEAEPEYRKGYIIEVALWVEIDGMRFQVGSAFMDREAQEVDVWIDENEDVDNSHPHYIEAVHCFDHVVTDFVRSSQALLRLDRDFDEWLDADPENPFGDSPPAEDPVDYDALSPSDEKKDVYEVLREYGVEVTADGIQGIASLSDEDRQRMYVQLRKLQREQDNEGEEW